MSRFDTIGAAPTRGAAAQTRSAGRSMPVRGARRWPPVVALSAAAAVSAGLWVLVVAAVRAVF